MMPATVGAVIPVRNRWWKTARFLAHFSRQTYPRLRVYAVDSNSSDSTPDRLREIRGEKLILVEASDDDFWAGATNRGAMRALADGCEYILTINDDCIPTNTLVEQLVSTSQKSGYRIVGSRINYLQEPAQVWSVGGYNVWGTHLLFQLRENDVYESELQRRPGFADGYIEVDFMPGNGVLIHRSVFEAIGLYDERHYPHYHADSEFVLRARTRGNIRAIVDYRAVVYNDVSVTPPSPYLISRPVGGLRRRLQLFFSKRSERRLLTLWHYLHNYCPRGQRVLTAVVYVTHAVVHFRFPRLKALAIRLYAGYLRLRRPAWRALLHPATPVRLVLAHIHHGLVVRGLRRRRMKMLGSGAFRR